MFYFLHEWTEFFSPLRVFQYITVRAFCAAGTAFLLSLLLGPRAIKLLRRLKFGQQVRGEDELPMHGKKQGTPTMGGVLIIASVAIATLLWAVPNNLYVLLTLGTLVFMGAVGFLDDYLKILRKNSKGLPGKGKILLQAFWAIVVVTVLWTNDASREYTGHLMVPFLKEPLIDDMGYFGALAFLGVIIIGASNAVNLTDGLDGLAIGCSNSAAVAYLVMAYVAGHFVFADYLQVPHVPNSGELAVFCGALLGAGLGFLWYNCHPAQIFMGDTGSLALGGAIAMVAICIKQELVLIIVGGVFVMEAFSVMIQVLYFKFSGGKRVFRCAPIHHHFEQLEKEKAEKEGRDLEVVETMVSTRFWILSIIFALIGVATLKIR